MKNNAHCFHIIQLIDVEQDCYEETLSPKILCAASEKRTLIPLTLSAGQSLPSPHLLICTNRVINVITISVRVENEKNVILSFESISYSPFLDIVDAIKYSTE